MQNMEDINKIYKIKFIQDFREEKRQNMMYAQTGSEWAIEKLKDENFIKKVELCEKYADKQMTLSEFKDIQNEFGYVEFHDDYINVAVKYSK